MRPTLICSALMLCLTFLGCSEQDTPGQPSAYDDSWGAQELVADGKGDGLMDVAQRIEFGASVSGFVGGEQVNIYRMDLRKSDQLKVEMTVDDGDLNPHLTLYYGTSSHISSEKWERDANVLRKWYQVENSGTFMLAARAYKGKGSGQYTIIVTCEGGPCNGEFEEPDTQLRREQVSECIRQARICALERMGRYDGTVGATRAKALLDECLGEASLPDGAGCTSACDVHYEDDFSQPTELCKTIQEGLQFYADKSESCLKELNGCLGSCYDNADDYWEVNSFYETPESICWDTGFNGNCDRYCRDHAVCGGTRYDEGNWGECSELCESTTGAWIDDLDKLCDDECFHICRDLTEDCEQQCENDDTTSCVDECVKKQDPTCEDPWG